VGGWVVVKADSSAARTPTVHSLLQVSTSPSVLVVVKVLMFVGLNSLLVSSTGNYY